MKITKPNRASRSYTQRLVAGPSRVVPLLCLVGLGRLDRRLGSALGGLPNQVCG